MIIGLGRGRIGCIRGQIPKTSKISNKSGKAGRGEQQYACYCAIFHDIAVFAELLSRMTEMFFVITVDRAPWANDTPFHALVGATVCSKPASHTVLLRVLF